MATVHIIQMQLKLLCLFFILLENRHNGRIRKLNSEILTSLLNYYRNKKFIFFIIPFQKKKKFNVNYNSLK